MKPLATMYVFVKAYKSIIFLARLFLGGFDRHLALGFFSGPLGFMRGCGPFSRAGARGGSRAVARFLACAFALSFTWFACSLARSCVCLVQLLVCLLVRSLVRLLGLVRPLRIINTKINKVHLPVYNVHLRSSNTKTNMKYLLLGNSNASRASDLFITKDHALKKERRFVKCTSAMAFKLQVTKVRKKNCQMS